MWSLLTSFANYDYRALLNKVIPFPYFAAGLFLHIGYSLTEQHLTESSESIRISVESMRVKFVALLQKQQQPRSGDLLVSTKFI